MWNRFQTGPGRHRTILYSFTGGTDGAEPFLTLGRDAAGNLYGTTLSGGDLKLNVGTVFKLDASGTKTLLHTFTGYPSDGSNPYAAIARNAGGNLYDTTYFGGNSSGGGFCELNHLPTGGGIVFQVDKKGKETVIYNFVLRRRGRNHRWSDFGREGKPLRRPRGWRTYK